jgi:hypothetical protein
VRVRQTGVSQPQIASFTDTRRERVRRVRLGFRPSAIDERAEPQFQVALDRDRPSIAMNGRDSMS